MKIILYFSNILCVFCCINTFSQTQSVKSIDSLSVDQFEIGTKVVNQCTPWHHLKCIYITGKEVYKDGSEGKSTRHWWRMSYIGRACTASHGTTFGKIFEGVFVVPHYIGVALGNGIGLVKYALRGSPEKIALRKARRKQRREERKQHRMRRKSNLKRDI